LKSHANFWANPKKQHDILRLHKGDKAAKKFSPFGRVGGWMIKGWQQPSTAAPLNALPMKTSNS
jgi:hypothetical protein